MRRSTYDSDGDYYMALALQRINHHHHLSAVGSTPDSGTAGVAFSPIWDGGPAPYPGFPLTAGECEVFSTSTEDSVAGTGMRVVIVDGLQTADSVHYEQVGYVTAGTTPVSIGSWYRIRQLQGYSYGANEANIGTVTARFVGDPSVVFAHILPGNGNSQNAIVTIPKEVSGYVFQVTTGIGRPLGDTKKGEITGLIRVKGRTPDQTGWNVERVYPISSSATPYNRKYTPPLKALPGTDIIAECTATIDNIVAYFEFDMAFVDDDHYPTP